MKKTLLTTFIASVTAMVLTGCGASSMPSPETLKKSSVEDFLEGQGFSWDDKEEIYELRATKNRKLDKEGDWTISFKELYNKRFTEYCVSKGGNVENIDDWQKRIYPIGEKSTQAKMLIYNKLTKNIRNWQKIKKLCSINKTPLFGWTFSSKDLDISRSGVDRENFDARSYKYDINYRYLWDNGGDANFWWNIEAYAVPIKSQDFEDAKLFISSYLKHNHFEKDKKVQQPAIQKDKNYTTPSSGFRRF